MTKKSYVAENGIILGLMGLALLVIFAIALPRWTHAHDNKAITLPSSLSDGLVLINAQSVPAAAQYLQQFATLDSSTASALGVASASGVYANQASRTTVVVQAVRKAGGLILLGQPGGTISKVGHDECLTVSGTDQTTGQTASSALCRRSSGELTVQVAGNGTAATLDQYLDQTWKKIS